MNWARSIASGCGCGYAPVAPGTVASAIAAVTGAGLASVSTWLLAAAALAATLGGFWAVKEAKADGDPGWIVIDEFAGQWIALLGLGSRGITVLSVAGAFLLFRIFDIWKPGPVGWADRWHTPAGVMADEIGRASCRERVYSSV